MVVRVSAPGKLFVIGEYGVLVGEPAVIATLDQRLTCRVAGSVRPKRVALRSGDLRVDWDRATGPAANLPAGLRFAAAAAAAALDLTTGVAAGRETRGLLEIEIEHGLDDGTAKRGLGGSSAVVAAVLGAIHAHLVGGLPEGPARRTLAAQALAIHRKVQGGGSGADAAAAVLGGPVLLRVSPVTTHSIDADLLLDAEPLALPDPLAFRIVATGKPAASGPRARRFVDSWQGQGPLGEPGGQLLREWGHVLAQTVLRFRDACLSGRKAEVLAAFRQGALLLGYLERLAGLPMHAAGLRRACAVAARQGIPAKPSGAGGGDCAIAIISTQDDQPLRRAWLEQGFEPLEIRFGSEGLRLEEAA